MDFFDKQKLGGKTLKALIEERKNDFVPLLGVVEEAQAAEDAHLLAAFGGTLNLQEILRDNVIELEDTITTSVRDVDFQSIRIQVETRYKVRPKTKEERNV